MTFFVEIDKEAKTFILVVNRLLLLTNKNPVDSFSFVRTKMINWEIGFFVFFYS